MLAGQITIDEYMESRKEHITTLHESSKGWITLADIKQGNYKQWHYKYNELLMAVGESDYYISQNTFYKPQRRIENIKELKALYIDLDYYKTTYTRDSILYLLENDFFNRTIPKPNLVIDSGRGLYLIWQLEAVPSMALPLWRAVEEYLYRQLKEFGADNKALDPTRILRVAGTINSKSNTAVSILDTNYYEYTLREIQDEFLPELKGKNKTAAKGRPKKVVSLFNKYSLHYARIQDIVTICQLRLWDLDGHRELILFLYRYWNCVFTEDTEEALRRALELNEQFIHPLPEREVIRATKSAERCYKNKDKQYNYSNNKLIDLLDISEEEQKQLKTIIGNKEKNRRKNEANKEYYKEQRRNPDGLTTREQNKINNMNSIRELKEKGFKLKEIAEKLSISLNTVKDYLYKRT